MTTSTKAMGRFEVLVLACFRAPLEAVRAALEAVIQEHFAPHAFALTDEPFVVDWVYEARPPRGGAHLRRVVLFEPSNAPGTTAMMANIEDGWMTLVYALARKVPGEHVLARCSEDPEFPLADLEVWIDGVSVRYVGALRDPPKWSFQQRGEPRPFEDEGHYRKRNIRDRLNSEIVFGYLRTLGWDVDSSAFWASNVPSAHLVELPRSP